MYIPKNKIRKKKTSNRKYLGSSLVPCLQASCRSSSGLWTNKVGSVPSSQIQNKEEGSTFGSEYGSHGELQRQKHVYRAAEAVLRQPPGQTIQPPTNLHRNQTNPNNRKVSRKLFESVCFSMSVVFLIVPLALTQTL